MRRLPALFLLCTALAGLVAPAAAQSRDSFDAEGSDDRRAGRCEPRPLDILLTNDDGWQAPGIRALLTSLRRAGHTVPLVAPATNQSGSSAALTFSAIQVTRDATDTALYGAAGSPATAALLGLTGILGDRRPDLVVSGINEGANLGPATTISGTVGATIAALQLIEPGLPSVAISTDLPTGVAPGSPAGLAHFANVADFLARLVGQLAEDACDGNALIGRGLGLNVNYPPLAPADVKGVRMATQGQKIDFAVRYQQAAQTGPNSFVFAPAFGAADPTGDVRESDTLAFRAGYVTIVPIDGNYTAPPPAAERVQRKIKGLKP